MSKKVIRQKASDNQYYHPDFHIALNHGIEYLHSSLGEEAVRQYLAEFARVCYASLKRCLADNGLMAIRAHYERIYKIEHAVYNMQYSADELHIRLAESPAVMHIRTGGHRVSPVYHETIATVNNEICRNTAFDFELVDYHPGNGAYHLRFFRREK
jgi:hypothetical protein